MRGAYHNDEGNRIDEFIIQPDSILVPVDLPAFRLIPVSFIDAKRRRS